MYIVIQRKTKFVKNYFKVGVINNEKKCKFLPGLNLPENIQCSTNFEEVIKDTEATWKATIKADGEGPWDKIKKEGWVVFATNNDSIIGQVKFISEDLTTFEILTERNPDGAEILYYLGE